MLGLLRSLSRKVASVYLDTANENMNYTPEVDIADLVKVDEVMVELVHWPKGGLVYAMQFLLEDHLKQDSRSNIPDHGLSWTS